MRTGFSVWTGAEEENRSSGLGRALILEPRQILQLAIIGSPLRFTSRLFVPAMACLQLATIASKHGLSLLLVTQGGRRKWGQENETIGAVDMTGRVLYTTRNPGGGLAQLGERLNGIQEVTGSSPVSSTILRFETSLGKVSKLRLASHLYLISEGT